MRIGRGPATVIGTAAVSQATLPWSRGPRPSRERAKPSPGRLAGLFVLYGNLAIVGNFLTSLFPSRLGLAACAAAAVFSSAAGPSHPQSAIRSSDPAAFREVVDETGRTVRIPQPVRRIVSLAPSLTETIYALSLQDRLVGDTEYCDYPPDAKTKTKVGGGINPSLEVIASLHPDLVLATKSFNRPETTHALDELGMASYATDPHTLRDIISSIKTLADVLGVREAGASVAEDMQRHLSDLEQRLGGSPPKRVLFVVWTQPLISTGQHTFLADALRYAGAVSIVNSAQDWPQVNLEEVAKLQPDFLVFAESHSGDASREVKKLATLPGWKILRAIRNRRYAVTSDAVNRPAPRIVSAIEDLALQLHPEAFAEKPGDKQKENEREHPPLRPAAFAPSSLNLLPSLDAHPGSEGGCTCGG